MLTIPFKTNIATYAATTSGSVGTSTGTNTVVSLMTLWSAASNQKRTEIYRITCTMAPGVAGSYTVRGNFITAENGTPGGATITPAILDRDDPTSNLVSPLGAVRSGTTTINAPTRITSDIFCENVGTTNSGIQYVLFDVSRSGKPIVLRALTNEGLEIRSVTNGTTGPSTQALLSVTVYWTEV